MHIWRLQIKPDAERGGDPQRFCIENGVMGVGWPVEADEDLLPWDVYAERASQEYRGIGKWWPAYALHEKVDVDDLCWTRNSGTEYFLGRVVGPWQYRNTSDHRRAGIFNFRHCEWVRVGGPHDVPGMVLNSFRRRRTLQSILNEGIRPYSTYTFNELTKTDRYKVDGPSVELFDLLGPDECEDIVGIWLQSRGWVLIPSTCKTDFPKYEFILINQETGRSAAVQVKQGETTIDVADYNDDHYDEIYLFQTRNRYTGRPAPNVHRLLPSDMEDFCLTQSHQLSPNIRRWIKLRGLSHS